MITNIDITKLMEHPNNPRKNLGDLSELAESIKARGILQNLTVVPTESENYTVIIGHRRLAAAKLAGLTKVPCAVVEMDYKTQLSTMLLENMQRSDLTVYEQAQGMQMMFDLGVPVAEIVEKTGFAETTVRKRLKIATLPADRMKAAVERGGTLEDYIKITEIHNEKDRNSLLSKVGTRDFDFAYKTALREQREKELTPLVKEELKKIGAKVGKDMRYSSKYETVEQCQIVNWKEGTFKNPKNEPLFYEISYGWVYLLQEKKKAKKQKVEKSEKEKNIIRLNGELKKEAEIAYECRENFIRSFTATQKYKDVISKWLMYFAAYELNAGYNPKNYDYINSETGAKTGVRYIHPEEFKKFVAEDERATIVVMYALAGDSKDEKYYNDGYYYDSCSYYMPKHKENSKLDKIYECLCELGYEMSKPEMQLQNGTHELLEKQA